jgi:protein TonB
VLIYLYVDKHGNPYARPSRKGAGMGLDEKAVGAIKQYKFKPAT